MSGLDTLRLALGRLRVNGVRSVLTVLGVVIGVAAVITVVAYGKGAGAQVQQGIARLGTNLLTVTPGQKVVSGVSEPATLTLADAQAIGRLPQVRRVDPELAVSGVTVVSATHNATATVVGASPAYASVRNAVVEQGAFLNDVEYRLGLPAAVLGSTLATDLGITMRSVPGSTINVGGTKLTVVGILAPTGTGGPANSDNQVIVPLTVALGRLTSSPDLAAVAVSVNAPTDTSVVTSEIESAMVARHGSDDVFVATQAQLLATASSVSRHLTALLIAIASVSLLIGGIGIMNVMLVGVRERTREIGIRMAIGARGSAILRQFLIEALILSLAGGLVGVGLGVGAADVTAHIEHWPLIVPATSIAMAVTFAGLVGLVFGVYPAIVAARLDPIVALRHE